MRSTISPRRRSQSLEVQKRPAFFSLPRQPPFVISRDRAIHRDIERPPISRPMPMAPRSGTPHLKKSMPPPRPVVSVSPHTSAWIQVADQVVGRHPHGKPLVTRVATPAEIALISGHIHIPWAYAHVKKPQPVPVKIQKPAAIYAPLSIMPSLVLEDVGNAQDRLIWRAVHNNARRFKGKSLRHARGKENDVTAPLPAWSSRC
ncbi:hypothetical protein BYT27DRAFT_7194787 [Phlegmacium glaucopus]|nr:hypothetical protein BYT27DRAFT_7194787 [Phlegmacium glaucopus]